MEVAWSKWIKSKSRHNISGGSISFSSTDMVGGAVGLCCAFASRNALLVILLRVASTCDRPSGTSI